MKLADHKYLQKVATALTLLSMAASLILLLFVFFGPKEGMEAMIILIPWLAAGVINLGLGILAIISVFLTRSFLKNSWILAYFALFFGINGYLLAVMNQWDKALTRQLHTITRPAEAELYTLLRKRQVTSDGRYLLAPGAMEEVAALISAGADLSYISPGFHQSMLLLATPLGDPQLIALMIDRGATVEGKGDSTPTPLAVAVATKQPAVVQTLLAKGADPNHPIYRAYPPLIVAAKEGNSEIVRLLLQAGAKPDTMTSSSPPALVVAAGKGNDQVMAQLLAHGADPNIVAYGGWTPLLAAVKADCVECVRLLTAAGADGRGQSARRESALTLALQKGNAAIISLLSSQTALLQSAEDLFLALDHSDFQLFAALLELGLDPNGRDSKGYTPLMKLANTGKYTTWQQEDGVAAAKLLLARGANPDLTYADGTTALHWAARAGDQGLVSLLLSAGANPNLLQNNGHSPLLAAIQNDHDTIVNQLLAAGADPKRQAVSGMNKASPLLTAAQKNNPGMLNVLFQSGAEIDPASRDLCDVLGYGGKNLEMVKMIVDTGVDLNQPDPLNRYAINMVIKQGNSDAVRYLLERGAQPILPGYQGLQPFMHFVKEGQAELVATSIKVSPTLRHDPKLMHDGMYWAVRAGHPEVVKVILEHGTFFQRIEEVEALLKWVKVPPATEKDKEEILSLFKGALKN